MTELSNCKSIPSSFRDPSGFVFCQDGVIYRQVNVIYKENYDFLISSGLYKALVDSGLLIHHDEVDFSYKKSDYAYKIIRPGSIPFISYPYEWCFSQLKDAALVTLKIQKTALDFGMTLKDCSVYNIQFRKGRPVFIDTLSFERYANGQPWVAYRQFCQHFLSPLALISHKDIRLNQLFRVYIDGVPLDLASSLLPFYTRFSFSLLSHIHLHAKSQKYFADKTVKITGHKMSRLSLLGLIDNLESAIKKMKWQAQDTEWADYYTDISYSPAAFQHKKQVITGFLDEVKPNSVWDLGANTGLFSRIASSKGSYAISFDIDPAAVEKNYLKSIKEGEVNILPLLLDLTNPSPSIGWGAQERMSLIERGPADIALALALIHHLLLSHNIPFDRIGEFFSKICNSLIIEFVPKNDSQAQRLLLTRKDIFPNYNQQIFESTFSKYFTIQSSARIRDSKRTLYLMKKRQTRA